MQNTTSLQSKKNTAEIKNVRHKDALMQAYRSWISNRSFARKLRSYQQPLDSDAFNEELMNALALK